MGIRTKLLSPQDPLQGHSMLYELYCEGLDFSGIPERKLFMKYPWVYCCTVSFHPFWVGFVNSPNVHLVYSWQLTPLRKYPVLTWTCKGCARISRISLPASRTEMLIFVLNSLEIFTLYRIYGRTTILALVKNIHLLQTPIGNVWNESNTWLLQNP